MEPLTEADRSNEAESPYPALQHLIQEAQLDRRAVHKAWKRLEEAGKRFNESFPDYAVLVTLAENAEADYQKITQLIERLEKAIATLDQTANTYESAVSEEVSKAVNSQIKDSLSKASDKLTNDVKTQLTTLNSAASDAIQTLNRLAAWTSVKLTGVIIFVVLVLALGFWLGWHLRS